MKTVIFLRHAKAERHSPTGADIDRPLAERGRRAAAVMGRFLAEADQVPELAITSPATRAAETLTLAVDAGSWKCEIWTADRLYDARPGEVLSVLNELDDELERVLLVGHEPTWSAVLRLLVGGGDLSVPTGMAARVDLDVRGWRHVEPERGRLAFLVPPRLVGGS